MGLFSRTDLIIKAVAYAIDRQDIGRISEVGFNLAPQILNMGVDTAIKSIMGMAVKMFQQALAAEGLAGMLGQESQQIKFNARQMQRFAIQG